MTKSASPTTGAEAKVWGQVGHLHTTISEEPQPNSTLRKSFLYLFDSVPGGTGYLRQLIRNPDHMRDVFDQALKVVRACGCQAEGKDGCYECLFAYRNSFDQDKTSRRRSQTLLSAIAKHWPNLAETSTGLSAIRLNSNFESELERRFIEAIRRYRLIPDSNSVEGQETILRKDTFNGKTGYYLKIGQSAWVIETQVSLGSGEGVAVPCRADFLIRPASVRLDSKPIVIFTDGWDYHKDRIGTDFEQRLAILRSNQFWCWSLTWDDVAKQLDPEYQVTGPDGLNYSLNAQFQSNPGGMYQKYGCDAMTALEQGTSFEWLMHYLAHPSASTWQQWGLLRTMAQADQYSFTDQGLQSQWSQQIQELLGELALDYWEPPPQFINGDVSVSSVLRVWHGAALSRHVQLDPTGSLVLIQFDDRPGDYPDPLKHSWNEALRLLNLYQFLPHVYAITTTAISQGHQPLLANPPLSPKPPASPATVIDQGWANLRASVLEDLLLSTIDQMEQESWPLPEAGYELTNQRGKVIAEAELAWPGAQVAVLLTDDDQDVWAQAGWCAVTVDQFPSAMGTIKDRLPGA